MSILRILGTDMLVKLGFKVLTGILFIEFRDYKEILYIFLSFSKIKT